MTISKIQVTTVLKLNDRETFTAHVKYALQHINALKAVHIAYKIQSDECKFKL